MARSSLRAALLAGLLVGKAIVAGGSASEPDYTQFYYSKFPQTAEERGSVVSSPWLVYRGDTQPLQYHALVRTGNAYGPSGNIVGAILDHQGQRIKGAETCCGAHPNSEHMLSDMEDFASLLRSRSSDERKLWAVVHLEDVPAAMQVIEIRQEPNGALTPLDVHYTDFSADGGVVATCAGSVSPWNTHLGGEEWGLPDARDFESWQTDADIMGTAATRGAASDTNRLAFRYWGFSPENISLAALKAVFHPYMNGYPNEVAVDDSQEGRPVITAVKHYSMGRFAIELPYCLPTSPQVCYIADDRSNGVPCAYRPDAANNLSSGRLFCASLNMTLEPDPASALGGAGEYDVNWIDLGHATDVQIKAAITAGTKFADLFETAEFNRSATNRSEFCPPEFTPINAGSGPECLKLIGDPILASRLETRRYAAMRGAATEWTKMEGVTFDPVRNEIYMAISDVKKGMEDNQKHGHDDDSYDIGGFNQIRAKWNPCGCVYRMSLDEGNFLTHIRPLICGNYQSFNTGAARTGSNANSCDIHSIANPDNIAFMTGHDKLFIGEDTGRHENNAVWVYDLTSQSLNRLMTVPRGAETTGIYFHADINGYAYIMNQVQHPDPGTVFGRNGTVGYLGPIAVDPARMQQRSAGNGTDADRDRINLQSGAAPLSAAAVPLILAAVRLLQ